MLTKFISDISKYTFYSIVVLKDGVKVAEYHREKEIRRNQFSATKCLMGTAIGIAVGEGRMSLDDKVLDYFPNDIGNIEGEQLECLRLMTVRDTLAMTAGYTEPGLLFDRTPYRDKDWVQICLNSPLSLEARGKFFYTNCTSHLAAVILEKVAGMNMVDYLMPRIFEPLGIERPDWEYSPQGNAFGGSGAMLTTNELSRFGQLYLQNGIYNGKRLIPEQWIKEATVKQVATRSRQAEKNYGYGYTFWLGREGSYRATGKCGQNCMIIPNRNVVVAYNADDRRTEEMMTLVWDDVISNL